MEGQKCSHCRSSEHLRVVRIMDSPHHVSTFHWTADNQEEPAHHTLEPSTFSKVTSQLMPPSPGKLGAAFCFKMPSPYPRSCPIALLSQSPDSCAAILHTSLTDKKKKEKEKGNRNRPIGNLKKGNTPFCEKIKKTGDKNQSGWG